MAVKPIPEGYHTITPYLIVEGAEKMIGFLQQAFAAEITEPPHKMPDGKVMHAEVKIGDSRVMLSDASPQHPAITALLHLYVKDTDATYKQALEAGATSVREPEDQFYGDRSAGVKDAFGNQWWISTHIEDVSPEEMAKRAQEYAKQHAKS